VNIGSASIFVNNPLAKSSIPMIVHIGYPTPVFRPAGIPKRSRNAGVSGIEKLDPSTR